MCEVFKLQTRLQSFSTEFQLKHPGLLPPVSGIGQVVKKNIYIYIFALDAFIQFEVDCVNVHKPVRFFGGAG